MITSVRMVNFKNFADETLKVGPVTIIVGANASGKSNIRDTFRFLHGIGRSYTLAEILGGKHGPGGQMEWEPIRGAPNEIKRFGGALPQFFSKFSFHTELDLEGEATFYSISLGTDLVYPEGFRVLEENLRGESTTVFASVDEDPFPVSPLHGGYGCQPLQPGHQGLLPTSVVCRQAEKAGSDRLHAQAAGDPELHAQEWLVLELRGHQVIDTSLLILKTVA